MLIYSYIQFLHFIVIHTIKGFVVNKAEINVFLELSCFPDNLVDVGNLISGFSACSKTDVKAYDLQLDQINKRQIHQILTFGIVSKAEVNKF